VKQFDLVFRRAENGSSYAVDVRIEYPTQADSPLGRFVGWVDKKVSDGSWTATRPDLTTVMDPTQAFRVRFFPSRQAAGEYLARTRVRQG